MKQSKDLHSALPYDEALHVAIDTLHATLKEKGVAYDGFMVTVYDAKSQNYFVLTSTKEWKIYYKQLPDSLTKKVFDTSQVLNTPHDQIATDAYSGIDYSVDDEVSAILLLPVFDDSSNNYRAVLSLYRHYKNDLNHASQPLVVGNQIVALSAKVTHTKKPNPFLPQEAQVITQTSQTLKSIIDDLLSILHQKIAHFKDQALQNKHILSTPQEIIMALIEVLVCARSESETALKIANEIQQHTHKDSSHYTALKTLTHICESINNHTLQAFKLTDTNDIVRSLTQDVKRVDTRKFFTHFYQIGREFACTKNQPFSFFLHPHIASKIEISTQKTHTFLSELFYQISQISKPYQPIHYFISPVKDRHLLSIAISFESTQDAQRQLSSNNDKSLFWAHKGLLESGGNLSIQTHSQQHVTCRITLPYRPLSKQNICDKKEVTSAVFAFFYDKKTDSVAANAIARYLIAMGVSQDRIIALDSYSDTLHFTHAVVFSSMASQVLQNLSPNTKVLYVQEGCLDSHHERFYDFSNIDLSTEKNRFYLDIVEEFLTLQGELS